MRPLEEVIKTANEDIMETGTTWVLHVDRRRELEEWEAKLIPWAIEHPESYAPQHLVTIRRLLGREGPVVARHTETIVTSGYDSAPSQVISSGPTPETQYRWVPTPSPAFQAMREACIRFIKRSACFCSDCGGGPCIKCQAVDALDLADAELAARGGEGRREMIRELSIRGEVIRELILDGIKYVPERQRPYNGETFGACIRRFRENAYRWSLDELAEKVGISKTYLWELETEKATEPSFRIAVKLATVLNIDLVFLAQSMEAE